MISPICFSAVVGDDICAALERVKLLLALVPMELGEGRDNEKREEPKTFHAVIFFKNGQVTRHFPPMT